jgi:hypothetical protein
MGVAGQFFGLDGPQQGVGGVLEFPQPSGQSQA